jgi:RimJ/RimL family protein N-acetyltransferase
VTTDRLRLTSVAVDDAEELFVIMSDPAGWWYQPAGRHTEPRTTTAFCEWVAGMWLSDGLSYWTARGLDSDEVVGLGGAGVTATEPGTSATGSPPATKARD